MSKLISTKDLNQKAYSYILACIDESDYDDYSGVPNVTPAEKLTFLYETFKSEHGYNIARLGPVNAFREWCQGLPSCFGLEFENYHILELAKTWGSLPKDATERQEDKILENYWNFIAVKTFQLFKKHKVSL